MHRPRQVLQRLRSEVSRAQRELARELVAQASRDADSARLGESLQPGGDVDRVAEDALALGAHLARVRAEAQAQPALLGKVGGRSLAAALDRERGARRIDRARELGEEGVAREVDQPPPVLAHDPRHIGLERLNGANGALFVCRHQPAVTGDVGVNDRREPAFDCALHCGTL